MFSGAAFAETGFSVSRDPESVFIGSLPVIYFNDSTLTFPLSINKLSNFSLKMNQVAELDLQVNWLSNFDLSINKLQNHDLKINTMINFNSRR